MSICFWFGDLSWGKRQLQFKKKIIFNLKYQFIKLKGIQEANIWKFFKYNMDNISIKKKKKKKREGSVSLSFEIHNTVVKKKKYKYTLAWLKLRDMKQIFLFTHIGALIFLMVLFVFIFCLFVFSNKTFKFVWSILRHSRELLQNIKKKSFSFSTLPVSFSDKKFVPEYRNTAF